MNKVVEILMRRDSMTQKEAEELLDQTVQELEANNWRDGEEIMLDYLGIEMDYLFDVIDWANRR